jgi:Domain of unknown function (DUF5658)
MSSPDARPSSLIDTDRSDISVIDLRDAHHAPPGSSSTMAKRTVLNPSSDLAVFLRRARISAAVMLIVLNIADLVTTKMFLDRGLEEGNPVSALLLSSGTMPFAKSAILIGLTWSAVRSVPKVATTCAMWFVVGLYTTVIGVNLLAISQLS